MNWRIIAAIAAALALALSWTALPAAAATAVVARVDQPENCLRIRSGPGSSYTVIGCASLGEVLTTTGTYIRGWAEISRPKHGWVYAAQLGRYARRTVERVVPVPTTVYVPSGRPYYYYGGPTWYGHRWYRGGGAGVVVGPRGGVGVRVGDVGVGVGPRGGVRVRVR